MNRVLFVVACISALIYQNEVSANPILASAFPGLSLPAITETCVDTVSPVMIPQVVKQPCAPSPNVLITDSSPSVCNNLANTLQLLIVSKLLQGNLAGCGVPLINEIPVFNPVVTNGCGQIVPNIVQNVLPNGCGCNTVLPQFGGPILI